MTPIDQDSQGSKIKNFQGPINIGAKGQIKMDFPPYRWLSVFLFAPRKGSKMCFFSS